MFLSTCKKLYIEKCVEANCFQLICNFVIRINSYRLNINSCEFIFIWISSYKKKKKIVREIF